MVTIDTFREIALSFPEATEEAHFEKTSFRVKKKIFATHDDVEKELVSNYQKLIKRYFLQWKKV